jgi:hypothetical protein
MSSDTVSAPRNLSHSLIIRLEEVESFHGGSVPLHSRLFSQLLHHAYPRECPFPHVKGSVSSVSPEEWEDISGAGSSATEEQMLKYQHAPKENHEPRDLPWTEAEELISNHDFRESRSSWAFAWLRPVAAITAFASVTTSMVRSSKTVHAPVDKSDRQLV